MRARTFAALVAFASMTVLVVGVETHDEFGRGGRGASTVETPPPVATPIPDETPPPVPLMSR